MGAVKLIGTCQNPLISSSNNGDFKMLEPCPRARLITSIMFGSPCEAASTITRIDFDELARTNFLWSRSCASTAQTCDALRSAIIGVGMKTVEFRDRTQLVVSFLSPRALG